MKASAAARQPDLLQRETSTHATVLSRCRQLNFLAAFQAAACYRLGLWPAIAAGAALVYCALWVHTYLEREHNIGHRAGAENYDGELNIAL